MVGTGTGVPKSEKGLGGTGYFSAELSVGFETLIFLARKRLESPVRHWLHARCRSVAPPVRFSPCTDCAIVTTLAIILTRALLALIPLPRGAGVLAGRRVAVVVELASCAGMDIDR
eukprot:5323220-Prymnesium_polylepis.1